MAKRLAIVAMMVAFVSIFGSRASALTINDTGVVGAASGESGDDSPVNGAVGIATFIANTLLTMGPSQQQPNPCSLSGTTTCFHTSSTDFNGTVSGGTELTGTDASGFLWAVAKYAGPNAGYVLFHVPTFGATLPQLPATIWGNTQDTGLGISHFVGFGTSTTVPDGGATLGLLGLGMLGLGYLRRRKN